MNDAEERIWEATCEENRQLRTALDKIVDLYGHYADLLNGYDGGRRMRFKSGQEWLDRLQELAMEESHELHRNAMTDERLGIGPEESEKIKDAIILDEIERG